MHYTYKTKGTCAVAIQFDIDNFSVYNDFFGIEDGNDLLYKKTWIQCSA